MFSSPGYRQRKSVTPVLFGDPGKTHKFLLIELWFPSVGKLHIPDQTALDSRRRLLVMIVLACGGFSIGTTESLPVGLLNEISDSLLISEQSAGRIVSAYALGVVIGAPLITIFSGGMPRRKLLILLMGALALGDILSLVAGLSQSYLAIVLGRFLAGFPHGAYYAVAALCAAAIAPPEHRGRAVAMVSAGNAISRVIGTPVTQTVGHHFGWPVAFGLVSIIAASTMTALWLVMPHMSQMVLTDPRQEIGALKRKQVWFTLGMGAIGFGGVFAVFTYISWIMTDRAGVPESSLALVLGIYGVCSVFGNWLGGRLADLSVDFGILGILSALAVILGGFTLASKAAPTAILFFALLGVFGAALVPALQVRLIDAAGEAKTLAGALNHSALNIANASGAALGGAVIAAGYGYAAPAVVGACLALAAMLIWIPARLLR